MEEIWKYKINIGEAARFGGYPVPIPVGAIFLSCQTQWGEIVTWWRVDTQVKMHRIHHFHVFETGQPIYNAEQYLGTVQLKGGDWVLHIYDQLGQVVELKQV